MRGLKECSPKVLCRTLELTYNEMAEIKTELCRWNQTPSCWKHEGFCLSSVNLYILGIIFRMKQACVHCLFSWSQTLQGVISPTSGLLFHVNQLGGNHINLSDPQAYTRVHAQMIEIAQMVCIRHTRWIKRTRKWTGDKVVMWVSESEWDRVSHQLLSMHVLESGHLPTVLPLQTLSPSICYKCFSKCVECVKFM